MLYGGSNGGLEIRRSEDGATQIRGRFPYGVATVLWDGGASGQARKEVIAPRAFAKRVADADQEIHFLAGHDFDRPLASRKAGSLTVTDGNDALTFEATITPEMRAVSYVQDFLGGLTAGLVMGLSPGFRVGSNAGAESVASNGTALLRTVRSADLFEISAVTRPAYPDAQIEARNWSADPQLSRISVHPLNRWRL